MAAVTAVVTPEAYRPLLRVSRALCLGCSPIAAGGWAVGEPGPTIVFGLYGGLGLVWWVLASGYTAGYLARTKHAKLQARALRPSRADEVPAATWLGLPAAPAGVGYLYVIQFSSGTIKVGRTGDPASRLRGHRRHAWAFGVSIARAWVSNAHPEHEATETRLIDFAASTATGDRARREFFHGADFDKLVRYATTLAERNATG